jgi:hypothetical protein
LEGETEMLTRTRIAVAVILVLVILLSAWSSLRFVDDNDFEPQRIRLEDHPAFREKGG